MESDSDIEQIIDESHRLLGKGPALRSSDKGIVDMIERIRLLNEQKQKLLAQMEIHPTDTRLDSTLASTNLQLREAKERLAEYQTQLKGQN